MSGTAVASVRSSIAGCLFGAMILLAGCGEWEPPTDPSAASAEHDPGSWATLAQAGIAAGEYQPVPAGDALEATNRAQGFHAHFGHEGVSVGTRGGARVRLALHSWGREGASISASEVAPEIGDCQAGGATDALGACLRRVQYRRTGVIEWWENRREGLEQGFTIDERPEGSGALILDLEVQGAAVEVGDAEARFVADDGAELQYSNLIAIDGEGTILPSWMEASGRGVRLVVDDGDAVGDIHIDPLLTAVSWTAEGDQGSAGFGFSASSAGDVNGDGFGDVIVGAYLYDNGQLDEGRAYLYAGAAGGLATTATWTAESNQTSAYFGWSVANAGDVNGDGYGDVVVGATQYDNGQTDEGRVYVYLGSASGLGASAAWTAESDQAAAGFGTSVASAGDVNGDGYADLIVGSNLYDNGQTDEGRASLYLGSAVGLSTSPAWTAEADQATASFGVAVASAGDVNADGYNDVLVGASLYDNGQTDEGRVSLYLGTVSGLAASAAWSTEADQANANLGAAVAPVGDVNGDGYSDVVVGAFQYDNGQTDEGRAWVYLGSALGLSTSAAWTGESDQASANYGGAVSGAGDVNGDGYSDLVVAAHRYDNGQTDEGMAYLYLGTAAGLSGSPIWTAESGQTAAFFGRLVSAAGDVNGDGLGDVIIGAPQFDNGAVDKGRTSLYLGAASGMGTAATWSAESDQASGSMGASVATAGDVNGDGYADVIVGAPGYTNGSSGEGRAFLYLGASTGLSGVASWTAESDQANAGFGAVVASAGDVNGDGYGDVLVGSPTYDNGSTDEGRAWLYLGSAAGLSVGAAWTAEANQDAASFGEDLAAAGDVNGDGYGDVVVGARTYQNGDVNEGQACVYYGSSGGLMSSPAWTAEGGSINAWFGDSVGSAGDVNGDGYGDVVVGCSGCANGALVGGRALVYLGSSAGLPTTPNWTAESTQNGSLYGSAVASAGDVNGDGYGDVIVGASNYNGGTAGQGRAYVYLGASTGPAAAASWTASTTQTSATLGYEVGSAGDVNGDGYGDVVISAPGYDGTAIDSGRVYVYLGAGPGLLSSAAWTGDGGQLSTSYGTGAACAGDVNGDGFSDLVVGASGWENGATDEGRALLYLGNGGDNTGLGLPQLAQARQPGTSTPIAAGLVSSSTNSFDVRLGKARSMWGPSRARLQIEVKPLGQAFDGIGRTTAGTETNTGLVGVTLQQTVSGLTTGAGYHWRARTLFSPAQGVKQGWGHWYYGGTPGDPRGGHLYAAGSLDQAPDVDGDTFGDAALAVRSRTGPIAGYISEHSDCDDGDAAIHPGAVEVCNGDDDDCDAEADELGAIGQAWYYADTDHDDWGSGALTLTCPGVTYVGVDGDCDDGNAEVNPDAAELCDELDNDCDGIIDPGTAVDAAVWYRDNDADGYGITRRNVLSCESPTGYANNGTDCDDAASAVYPGASELCNDLDDNCDGVVDPATSVDAVLWFRDRDGDGYGVTRRSAVGCEAPAGFVSNYTDCNDASATVHPGAAETCNAVDDDCDGGVDETGAEGLTSWYVDGDGDGYGGTSVIYACSHPVGTVPGSTDCNDGSSAIHPGAADACNGIDDDCSGTVDDGAEGGMQTYYVDADGDGYGGASSVYVCTQPGGTVTTSTDCDDGAATTHPGATEACNGIDDDCTDVIDDGAAGSVQTWYVDLDGDGYGDPATAVESCTSVPGDVLLGGDCDDDDEYAYPGAPELCDGGLNDCADSGSWVAANENNTASLLGTDGSWTDYTTAFTNGTSASVPAVALPDAGTLYVCDGTYHVSLTAGGAGTLSLVGWNGAAAAFLSGSNLSRVLAVTNAGSNVTIDGLTLTQGAAPGSNGGCVSVSAGTVSLMDSVVTACSAFNGGGVYLSGGTVSLSNTDLTSNSATNGGAVYQLNGTLSLTDSDATSNTAAEGGAVYFNHGAFTLTRGLLNDNLATGSGGAIRANAGFTVTDSTLELNDASNGAGVYFNSTATLQLTNTLIIRNDATLAGGGIYSQVGGTVACTGTTAGTHGFIGNTAMTTGGGVHLQSSAATLRSTICDWGTGGSTNTIADIVFVTNTYNKSNNQTFTCSAGTCP